MVAPTKVGKQRPFIRGLLLTIVTFGIYALWWHWKTNNEVFEQFELKKEGKEEGVLFFLVGILVFFVMWIYYYKQIENLQYVRGRMGLDTGVSFVPFILWATIGALIIVGPFIAYYKLQTSYNEVWDSYDQRAAELGSAPTAIATTA